MKVRPWTGQETQQCIQLNAELLSFEDIGEYLGRSAEAVRQRLQLHGYHTLVDKRMQCRLPDANHLYIKKAERRGLAPLAKQHSNGSIRDLVHMLMSRAEHRPDLIAQILERT